MTASKEAGWRFTAAASKVDRMTVLLRLENVADTKGRRSEQVACSGAECQRLKNEHDDCLYKRMIGYGIH